MDAEIDMGDEEISFVTESLEDGDDDSSSSQHLNSTAAPTTTEGRSRHQCATPQPPSITNRRPNWSAYDPYSPGARPRRQTGTSLLDAENTSPAPSAEQEMVPQPNRGRPAEDWEKFLEMEDDETSTSSMVHYSSPSSERAENGEFLHNALSRPSAQPTPPLAPTEEPIVTSSGLLLTHRRTTPAPRETPLRPNQHYMSSLPRNLHREGFDIEGPSYNYKEHGNRMWAVWRRRASLVWVWIALSGVIFITGSAVLWHHVSAADQQSAATGTTTAKDGSSSVGITPEQMEEQYADRIVLLPMNVQQQEQVAIAQQQFSNGQPQMLRYPQYPIRPPSEDQNVPHRHRRLSEWHEAFDAWARRHGKTYETKEERDYRLKVWMENHHRTKAKNEKHGPCPLMQRPVFGNGNHFQDLTREEFRSQYLNAQRKPRRMESPHNAGTLGEHVPTRRHADVHHRILQYQNDLNARPRVQKSYNCKWYDVSCNLRWFIETYFYGYFGIGRTMEPAYDKDSYPNAIDWRSLGAVTDVRAQDNCGACWAITAVETLESALYIATGELRTLSETEVILCNEDCKMCAGGWPENAFDYIMEHQGIPLQSDLAYDGEYLLKISNVLAGESDELSSYDINRYKYQVCPAGGSNDSKDSKDSQDNEKQSYNDDYYAPYDFSRYGGILAGYGYATEPCKCYTDGSGCSCDSQDENMAVRNVATYGPAVVCVDASDWQDYEGGILTSASGCSADFMDVNHCVQVVGYAFSESQGNNGSADDRNSGSNDQEDRDLASGDEDVTYDGYWIVRNQWSEYWGMSGYAYVAMGDNTCGILNDMIQVYTED